MANHLAIRRPDIDEEKFRLFTEEAGRAKTEEITNEELQAAERLAIDQELNEFFGMDGGLEGLYDLMKEDIETLEEQMKDDVIKVEELEAETEDPFHLQRFENEQKVFQKRRVEEAKEAKRETSTSTDYVKDEKSYGGTGYSTYNKPSAGYTYGGNKTYSSYSGGGYTQPNKSASGDGKVKDPKRLNEDVGFIASKVQDVAAQKVNGWKEKAQETGWGGKPSWKRRIRNFFRTKKARILLKTGMLMTLQLGMAIVGKKYEFEGMGQAAMFLGMMMGVFYLTRELVEDGFDPRGFGIL
jgi:hypothetical protein